MLENLPCKVLHCQLPDTVCCHCQDTMLLEPLPASVLMLAWTKQEGEVAPDVHLDITSDCWSLQLPLAWASHSWSHLLFSMSHKHRLLLESYFVQLVFLILHFLFTNVSLYFNEEEKSVFLPFRTPLSTSAGLVHYASSITLQNT